MGSGMGEGQLVGCGVGGASSMLPVLPIGCGVGGASAGSRAQQAGSQVCRLVDYASPGSTKH
jgi:hypothetical protein